MKIFLIEGSAKRRKSASSMLLDGLREQLAAEIVETAVVKTTQVDHALLTALAQTDAAVLAFPLYIDGIPSHFLRFLEAAEPVLRAASTKPVVYALMNCGFYEGTQCTPALEMLRNWCARAGAAFGGGLAVGAGGALTGLDVFALGQGPKKTLGGALEAMAAQICVKACKAPVFISLDMSWEDYRQMGEAGWRKAAQKRGLTEEDLSRPCSAPENE